ncbi:integrase [Bifidobacterium myosotis]|uniref:Integrase n=2 Tax=Bifidobacterium myosotis TaxID=1630166 RepID=A0A5M9ZM32_9BIFI|nr:integrase [Bifidobacterium myosotis]
MGSFPASGAVCRGRKRENAIMEFKDRRQPPDSWIPWLDQWVADMRFRNLSERSIGYYWYKITDLARLTNKPPWQIDQTDLKSYIVRPPSNAARRSTMNAVRNFFGWAKKAGLRADNPAEDLPSIKRETRHKVPAPETAVGQGLHDADRQTRLMVMLAAEAGLRRAEIAIVRREDVTEDLSGRSLIVHGKGAKDRIVPLTDELADAILASPKGWLFPHVSGKGPVCGDTVYRRIQHATGCSPHTLRHRFATAAYISSGGDIRAVQELLGHESLATTQAYVTVTPLNLRSVVNSVREYGEGMNVGQVVSTGGKTMPATE